MKNRKRNSLGQFTKESRNTEVSFINLSTYTTPDVKEVANQEWVAYGEDNNYFQYLIDRYNGSPTNNAAINGISQQIYFLFNKWGRNPLSTLKSKVVTLCTSYKS